MKTPDGPERDDEQSDTPLAAAGAALADGGRWLWRGAATLARGVLKFIATVWRLTGALDAALWRGVTLAARSVWRLVGQIARVGRGAAADFAGWLPTRTGRAYSAFSGVILLLAMLWIADELSVAPAGGAIAGAAAAPPLDAEDPILARVEGRYVHLSEITSAALAAGALQPGETLTPESAFARELVQSYVEQRLLARAASDDGLHREPDIARRLAAARDRILASAFMERRLSETITDDAVKRVYERNADVTRLGEAVKCRHIVVATEAEANEIMAALGAGGDFAALAREFSLDRTTAPLGGETGYLTRDQMTPAFAEAAFGAPEGEIAPIFFTDFGWNILEIVDRRRTGGVPFADVAENIRRFLRLRAIEATVNGLKDESDVVYFAPEEAPASSAPPTLREDLTTGG